MTDHYFSPGPHADAPLRELRVELAGRDLTVWTSPGVFSGDGLDTGTAVLLRESPAPPSIGHVLDLGCGWGPIALDLALRAPEVSVWAVDVNDRALELTRRNAEHASLSRINAVRPEDVPADLEFAGIWSNPPIRVGKAELHAMLETWIPRLAPGASAWLVVQKHLGSDSLHRWLAERFPEFEVTRQASKKSFRVLRVARPA